VLTIKKKNQKINQELLKAMAELYFSAALASGSICLRFNRKHGE